MGEAGGHADAAAYANPPPPEPSDRDREWHARRYDALASGTGRDPPRDGGARYAPAHPATTREPHGLPTQRPARSDSREREAFAFDRGGARGGAASVRDPFASSFDREPLGPRPDARRARPDARRYPPVASNGATRTDAQHTAPPRRDRLEDSARAERELVLYGYPGDVTHLDVRRSVEMFGVPLARVHAFTDCLYVCPTYSAITDVPDSKCVAAYARARTKEDAKRMLDEVNCGVDGGPLFFRDAPLAAMRWDAPRPGVLKGIPRAPPPEIGVEVTRRYIGAAEPPREAPPRLRRDEKQTTHARRAAAPASRAPPPPPPASMPHPEWLGPNRCAVHACGQMGRLIGPQGACVIGMKKETGCEMSKLDDERMVVEGATQTLTQRGVDRVREEVSKWLRVGSGGAAKDSEDERRVGLGSGSTAPPNHPIVPWRPNASRGGGDVPTPAFGERRDARALFADSAPVSAASAKSHADALSDERGDENGEIVFSGSRREDKSESSRREDASAGIVSDAKEDEKEKEGGYDAVADFSDCLPPEKAGQAERAAAEEARAPEPDAPSASGATAGETEPAREADDAPPPPPPPPPAEEPRAARSIAAAAAAEPAEEAEAPAPSAPASSRAASRPEVSPRERLLSLVRDRQLARDALTWRIAGALDPDRAPDPDPELAGLSPEEEVTREAKNLFVRHRVSSRRAPSGYLVSAVLSARPDESAREKTRAKPEDDETPLERDWTLALDERDDATPSADAKASGTEAAAAAASKGARSKTVAFVSLVSNVECEPAEVDAWVARRFSGNVDSALAWIEAAPVPETARKRPGPAAPSGAPPAKKKRGGGA